MSICLLCYAFPFYVSAITLARSELSPFRSALFLCISFFFHPLCALSYLFLLFFDVYSALMLSGFPTLGLCLRVTEVRIVYALLFPLYSLGRHSAKSSISLRYALFPLSYLFFSFFFLFKQLN